MFLLLLCSLFTAENAFLQRKNWNGDFTKVTYNPTENSITFNFQVFDYSFGPFCENGYLRWCDFYYTTEAGGTNNYTHLMRAETNDQRSAKWTWLYMRYKNPDAKLQLLGCYMPENGAMWPNTTDDVRVEVWNVAKPGLKKFLADPSIYALFTVKWYLGDQFKDVKRIRLNGFWKVNGFMWKGDDINDVYYDIPSKSMLKSAVNQPENNQVKVTTEADAIIVTGAALGQNVKVYNVAGTQVQSIVTKSDVVNIKLPKNQVYIVNVGKA